MTIRRVFRQDPPRRVSGKLPDRALCLVCSQGGVEEEEKPAGAVAYRGKTYYFCDRAEIERFLKDPETYLPAPVPRPAPPFALPTPAGETVRLEAFAGRLLLVDFWATWCAPCVKAMPEMQRLHERYGGRGLSVVGIAIDAEGAKKVAPFLAKSRTRFTYPMLLDTRDLWQTWGVKSLPSLALVRDGHIVRHWSGKIDPKAVEREIKGMLGAVPPPGR